MDIGLREWLIVIGIIVIAGILFDGWRRMRGGKGKLKLKLDRTLTNLPDEDVSDAELLGPARVVERREEPEFDDFKLSANDHEPLKAEPRQGDLNLDEDEPVEHLVKPEPKSHALKEGKEAVAQTSATQQTKQLEPFEEVLVINVVSRDEAGFKGPALLQNILESGLRFGEMDIFHRHESMAGNGEVLFSMANGVKPGVFDLDDIDLFSTRAVSFFLGLPGPRHPKQAFDVMVAAARKLASELDGELKDDQRSVLTAQTIEHYRQRIVEFERKSSLSQKR